MNITRRGLLQGLSIVPLVKILPFSWANRVKNEGGLIVNIGGKNYKGVTVNHSNGSIRRSIVATVVYSSRNLDEIMQLLLDDEVTKFDISLNGDSVVGTAWVYRVEHIEYRDRDSVIDVELWVTGPITIDGIVHGSERWCTMCSF